MRKKMYHVPSATLNRRKTFSFSSYVFMNQNEMVSLYFSHLQIDYCKKIHHFERRINECLKNQKYRCSE